MAKTNKSKELMDSFKGLDNIPALSGVLSKKAETEKKEPVKKEVAKKETAKKPAAKKEPVKKTPAKKEPVKKEAPKTTAKTAPKAAPKAPEKKAEEKKEILTAPVIEESVKETPVTEELKDLGNIEGHRKCYSVYLSDEEARLVEAAVKCRKTTASKYFRMLAIEDINAHKEKYEEISAKLEELKNLGF